MSEPSAYVTMNVGQATEESKIVPDSTDPRWEQGFRFLVNDPNFQSLDLQVMDKKTDKSLGELTVSMKELLSAPDMVMDQYFQLKKAAGNSEIQMRLALRILTTERSADWTNETDNLMTEPVEGVNESGKETDVDTTAPKAAPATTPTASKPATPSAPAGVDTVTATKVQEVKAAPSQPIPPAKKEDTTVRQRVTSSSSTNSNLGEFRLGKMQLTYRYSMSSGKLIVVVHKCISLLACDKDNFSDPYVKIYLMPGKQMKKKTKVINNNLNPVFDDQFEFDVTPQELEGKTLEFTVKNDTSMFSSSQKVLGVVEINLSQMDFAKAVTDWYDLHPNEEMKKKESDV